MAMTLMKFLFFPEQLTAARVDVSCLTEEADRCREEARTAQNLASTLQEKLTVLEQKYNDVSIFSSTLKIHYFNYLPTFSLVILSPCSMKYYPLMAKAKGVFKLPFGIIIPECLPV